MDESGWQPVISRRCPGGVGDGRGLEAMTDDRNKRQEAGDTSGLE